MRQPLVAGNWKMNGDSHSIRSLLDGILSGLKTEAEVLVCSPSVYIQQVRDMLTGTPVKWGLQNVSGHLSGAFTGETSPLMASDMGCSYIIVGHSERRALFGETDDVVAAKFCAVVDQGLVPVLCVGESLAQRENNETMQVVASQIEKVLDTAGESRLDNFVIAYEPVWAIGTGKTATPEQAQEVHAMIRQLLAHSSASMAEKTRVLYGGSMNAGNAVELMKQADVDGGLIGGASLKANEFQAICRAAG
ncbi:Triosephosphate isomerase [invertebrate metagenome]|uniref:triose-phosphate isomerase n=1 Tax=invertebrate metagenome TaxID=1711999 RepID=A0A2H9T8Y8_9ZZZZ